MKAAVRAVLAWVGYRIEGIRYTPRQLLDPTVLRHLQFDDIICRQVYEHGSDCVFLQVGAYDGVSTDPLRQYIKRLSWRGLMIEPQPGPASRLRALYPEGSGVTIVEAALDRAPGTRTLFTVNVADAPAWVGGMASFDRSHILKHDYLVPGIAEHVRPIEVRCVTFDEVLAQMRNDRLDILQIDAEGADGEILALFPFDRLRPGIVHWEVKNMTRSDQEETLTLLLGHGYRVARSGDENMLATLETAI